jgi:predicted Zn-dependent protease
MKPTFSITLCLALAGMACATNPVTGGKEFTLMSEAQEIQLGQQSDPEVRAGMGVYPDQALQEYVTDVGMRLARASQRPELPWHFAVVDVPAVNAFALPGGYIYITRGLLAHLDTEAEMAGVLGHEIGHVTARHAARAYTRSASVGIGAAITSILVPSAEPIAAAAQTGLGVLFLKYDRGQEVQSDRLGAEYVAKVGWAPSGMSGVLETLGRISAATDRRGVPNWLATHPQPEDRVAKVTETVQTLEATRPASEWIVNRDPYWKRLTGLIFGDNPREGVVRGREFIHPDMLFRLVFPEGWKIENGKQQVAAAPPDEGDVLLVLELVQKPVGSTLEDVAVGSMNKAGFTWIAGEATRLNGLPAYVGVYEGQMQNTGVARVRAAHIRHERQVFLLAGIASQAKYRQAQQAFGDTIRSFAPISAQDAARIKPNRLAFTTVRGADTWQAIADRTGGLIPAGELAVLNGFAANSQPPVGQRIKIVIASE